MTTVTVADVERARNLLEGVTRVTPMESSHSLTDLVGVPIHLKCENLQRAGSFKLRGAYTRIAGLSDAERTRGVVAASAGNHAQGVALAASLLGTDSTVFMPEGAALPKERATRAYGADVRLRGADIGAALESAQRFAEQTGAVLIHPFDHRDVIAGQGTLGLEVLDQLPDVATICVAMGGGGLVAGIAAAVRARKPDVRIVGVQAEQVAAWPPSLAAGKPVPVPCRPTMADGIAVGRPGDVPYELVAKHVDTVVTVSEESLSQALLLCLERAKLVVEPAGAASVAALLEHPGEVTAAGGPVVAVLGGGNIDPLVLMQVIRHGLAASSRYLAVRVRIPDRPGELVRLLDELARLRVNVLDVMHDRTSADLHVDEVDIALRAETRGAEHRDAVVEAMLSGGYQVTVG
jgi:threonine dehydratase